MKSLRHFLRAITFATLLGGVVLTINACGEDKTNPEDETNGNSKGTIIGIVTDDAEEPAPLSGVTVTVSDDGGTATTDANGKYTISDVTIGSLTVTFVKSGYGTVQVPLATASFVGEEKTATADAKMKDASYKMIGVVRDGNNGNAAIEGVTVSIGDDFSATTDTDGKYTIEGLTYDDYTVSFKAAGYTDGTKTVTRSQFVNKIAMVDYTFGGGVLLPPDKTAEDLQSGVQIWRYNDYRGGNDGPYPPFEWSQGIIWGLQVEGTALTADSYPGVRVLSNPLALENNPDPSTDVFDSYMYGRKMITAENCYLTVAARSATDDDATVNMTEWGVMVVDIESGDPQAKKIRPIGAGTDNIQTTSQTAQAHIFDLSDYIGQEIIIAVGIYRIESGNYNRNLILKRIGFFKEEVSASTATDGWIPGTELTALPDWRMSEEIVNSTMTQPKTEFSGITQNGSNNYERFQSWAESGHIGYEWGLMPLQQAEYSPSLEVFASQGYVMKTRWLGPIDLTTPELYLYAKFDVEHERIVLRARTFGHDQDGQGGWTYFRMTAVDASDYSVSHLPLSMTESVPNTASDNLAAIEDMTAQAPGMYRFRQYEGGEGTDEAPYAKIVWDISSIRGKEVVLMLGIYNGTLGTGQENKLCIYSLKFE